MTRPRFPNVTATSAHDPCADQLHHGRKSLRIVNMGQSCTAISGCDVAGSRTCCNRTEQNSVTRQRTLDAVKEEKFPMACMTVRTFLELDIFPPYGELKKRGLLVSPGTEIKVHFTSHEWLSTKHPDPSSVQLRLLQEVFRQILAGDGADLSIEDDWRTISQGVSAFWTSQFSDGEGSAQVDKVTLLSFAQDVEEGVVWLDFSSIPQMIDVQDADTAELLQHEMKQALAVQSSPYYLERNNYFWVLTPDAVHEHRKDICGFASWRGRSWCRLEEWANFLSKRCLMPFVVTDAPKISTNSVASFMADNLHKPARIPCMGEFSFCPVNGRCGGTASGSSQRQERKLFKCRKVDQCVGRASDASGSSDVSAAYRVVCDLWRAQMPKI